MRILDTNKLRSELEQLTCSIHGEHPTVFIEGQIITISSCCGEFQKELEAKKDIEVNKQQDNLLGFGGA
jgi:hypothetical protein